MAHVKDRFFKRIVCMLISSEFIRGVEISGMVGRLGWGRCAPTSVDVFPDGAGYLRVPRITENGD
jgi:hypothetical protein